MPSQSGVKDRMKKFLGLATLFACAAMGVASAAGQTPVTTQASHMSSSMSGTLTAKQGKFYLNDDASHTTLEVRGAGLKQHVGHQVNLTGELTVNEAGS